MGRYQFSSLEARNEIEAEKPWSDRRLPTTIYDLLSDTVDKFGDRDALSFQIESGPKDKKETLSWRELHDKSVQTANLFRSLGIGQDDVVAYVLPNANETVMTLLGGAIAGIVAPINPLLEPEQIASILRQTGAKVVVTLQGFPKTDVAEKVHKAIEDAPEVAHVLEIDLNRYLTPPKKWIVPLIRPKVSPKHSATVQNFNAAIAGQPKTLTFEDEKIDRVAAYFHTGGTTGMPKVAQHKYSGIIYNGWIGANLLFDESDVLLCPLPLFHVFAVHVVFMAVLTAGSHVVFPTPAGYRGDGVFDNLWKLIERYGVTFVITVPTAISAMMQRPVDADVSTLKVAFSGSAPLPRELFNRFEKATDVKIVEGYGLTEATCLVSCNPTDGVKKIGSVGIPFPYTDVKIYHCGADGNVTKECGVDEVGEICVSNPGVYVGKTYTDETKNKGLVAADKYLRTGDLGRIDEDGYLWITGRAKDIIIRGGHNIDPAEIEEVLAGHDAVAFVGAIGQPDPVAGELPCVFVELVEGATVTEAELLDYAKANITERAAVPKYIEIMDELPKTAVGKVFKPDLRKSSIMRVYNKALSEAGHDAQVVEVVEDKTRGLVAKIEAQGDVDRAAVEKTLGEFTRPFDWVN